MKPKYNTDVCLTFAVNGCAAFWKTCNKQRLPPAGSRRNFQSADALDAPFVQCYSARYSARHSPFLL